MDNPRGCGEAVGDLGETIHGQNRSVIRLISVAGRLTRPMERKGVSLIFSYLQNGQFHHGRLELLDHLIGVIYHFWMSYYFTRSPFVCVSISIIFASTLCIHVISLMSLTHRFDDNGLNAVLI